MALMNVFMIPMDGSGANEAKPEISGFLTVQSFANFAAMTGAITAAWHALQGLMPEASTVLVPYILAFFWGAISVLISNEGLKTEGLKTTNAGKTRKLGTWAGAIFVAVINSLVLAGAVVGTNIATRQTPP